MRFVAFAVLRLCDCLSCIRTCQDGLCDAVMQVARFSGRCLLAALVGGESEGQYFPGTVVQCFGLAFRLQSGMLSSFCCQVSASSELHLQFTGEQVSR